MATDKLLAYWITEREVMRARKDAGLPPPYHHNPAMASVRYCNVRREDDKVTRWLAAHWRPQYHEVWQIVLARMVNYIPTLEAILQYPLIIDSAATIMARRRGEGEKIWTSAYTISTAGASMDKIDYVMNVVKTVQAGWKPPPVAALRLWHSRMTDVKGLGSFLAAQVVADLKNTEGHPLREASDWQTWSAHGPGSLKGLSLYFGRTITPAQYPRAIQACWDEVAPLLPAQLQDLHMQDFQNCMCEFSKFMRVREGGRARNNYPSR